jgi:1,4-dihydroxy-2-naphthoate polyprenyltransferase
MSPRLGLPGLLRKVAADTHGSAGVENEHETSSDSGSPEVLAPRAPGAVPDPMALEQVAVRRVTRDPTSARSSSAAHGPSAAPPAAVHADSAAPDQADESDAAGDPQGTSAEVGLALLSQYKRAVLSWVEEDGYPVNVDIDIEVRPADGVVRFTGPAGFQVPPGAIVALTGSHIRVLAAGGFDQRRHVTIWGVASTRPRGRFALSPDRVWAWDEHELPLPAAYERSLPKARRFFEALSEERGEPIRPKVSTAMLLVRATRAPFLSATFAPVLLGLAVAARAGILDPLTAVITLVAASAVHLGLNVANDVFDTLQGADDANKTPTRFSGGSRVLQNALVSIREMSMLAAACYGLAIALGLFLLIRRGSPELVAIAALGLFISLAYTMPPLKLVYRGFGEVSTAIGFGPVMLLGTYVVQSRGVISAEAALLSIPVALFVAMILYVNEIPDRAGDSKVGKRTLPVRWSKRAVIRGFDWSVIGAFAAVAAGVALGILPGWTLLMLLAIPLATRVHSGLVSAYDDPYRLADAMGANIRLHLVASLLLLAGYLLAIAGHTYLGISPFFV